jgi:vacuolar iron transporter family protein
VFKLEDICFGATSAVITSLAIVVGLSSIAHAKASIVTALFIIAIADNISDSFGIHFHQESQHSSGERVIRITIRNFVMRLLITLVFATIVIILPLISAIVTSIVFGLGIIIVLSYFVSKNKNSNPTASIVRHVALALLVLAGSFLLRQTITTLTPVFFT